MFLHHNTFGLIALLMKIALVGGQSSFRGLTYKQMDGRSMELPDANFNVVIDKVQGTDDESS